MSKSWQAIIFLASVVVIYLCDVPLNDMLGEHPLQSELSLVEGHVQQVRREQLLREQGIDAKDTRGLTQEELQVLYMSLYAVIVLLISFALFWFFYRGFKAKSKHEIHVPVRLGLAHYLFVYGAFFVLSGLYYYQQAHSNVKENQKAHEQLIQMRKRGAQRNEQQRERDERLLFIVENDEIRRDKGLFLAVLGVLIIGSGAATHKMGFRGSR